MDVIIKRFVYLRKFYPLYFLLVFLMVLWACKGNSNHKKAEYPTRPITLLVPWSAGGMTDMTSRVMGAVLQNVLEEPVNVINKTGGGGVVGHLALSKARPDGYTLGAVTVEITMLPYMGLTDLSYRDFTPLALLINNAAAITVRKDAPWNTLSELISEIGANPGTIKASGTARGGIWDLARIGFLNAAGLPNDAMPWVPSQGAAPALQELLAGGVEVVTASLSEVDALRQADQVKTLGVMSEKRLAGFPEVPTLVEQGVDWSIGGWASICAPAGLPSDVVMKLDSAIRIAAQDSLFIKSLSQAGSTIQFLAGPDFSNFLEAQDKTNRQLMESAGIAQ
jgi:tripartite-type tricarboxylate transporter receptor subunit TctC